MTRDKRPQLSGQNQTDLMPKSASCKRWDTLVVLVLLTEIPYQEPEASELHTERCVHMSHMSKFL